MFRKTDIIFYLLFVFICIYPFISNKDMRAEKIGRIQIGRSYLKLFPLDKDTILHIDTLGAFFSVKIKDKTIKMIESACHNKLCIKQGAIDKNSLRSIVCLPQKIIIDICLKNDSENVKIESKKETIFDAIAE